MPPKLLIGLMGEPFVVHWLTTPSKSAFAEMSYCIWIDQLPFVSPAMDPPELVVMVKMSHSPPPAVGCCDVTSVAELLAMLDVPPNVVSVEQVESTHPGKFCVMKLSCEPVGTIAA